MNITQILGNLVTGPHGDADSALSSGGRFSEGRRAFRGAPCARIGQYNSLCFGSGWMSAKDLIVGKSLWIQVRVPSAIQDNLKWSHISSY